MGSFLSKVMFRPEEANGHPGTSVAEFQLFGDGLVSGKIGGVEVIQKTAALADHFKQAAPGAVIFDVFLQMLGQVVDPFREQGHLDISGPCVALMNLEAFNRLAFFHSRSVKLYFLNKKFKFDRAACKALFESFFEAEWRFIPI
jgi:hypothetical protein